METLSLSVENRIVSNHGSRRLSPLQIAGTARAVQFFPTETVAEIAHVHALGEVMSAAAVGSTIRLRIGSACFCVCLVWPCGVPVRENCVNSVARLSLLFLLFLFF